MAGERFYGLVGNSRPMRALYQRCTELARVDGPVLITGETGVGKTGVARLFHARSSRCDQPLQFLSAVGAEPESFAWELTTRARDAGEGILWIDEIGDLSADDLASVFDSCSHSQGPALLATTHTTLSDDLGRLFGDRILHVPPLRERPEDVPLLAVHFLCRFTRRYRKDLCFPGQELLEKLADLPWPGNVRELANEIEHAVVFTPDGGRIGWQAFSSDLREAGGEAPWRPFSGRVVTAN